MAKKGLTKGLKVTLGVIGIGFAVGASAQERLFDSVGPPSNANLPEHVSNAQHVRINRRALQTPSMVIDLFGEELTAERDRIERHKAGELVWVGHLQGNSGNTVIVTVKGNATSAFIQSDSASYRIGLSQGGQNQLYEIDLGSLPQDDADELPQGDSIPGELDGTGVADAVTQDLLVVYTQGACNYAGGCNQLEADIVTAVADMNTAYAQSGIDITMNLAGMALTQYAGVASGQALSDLRLTTDGYMDEIHPLRDQLGADIVSLIYDGAGCGIGYLGSGASSAFNVTDVPCLVGNRTMSHEIGHNQGAHHDRITASAGTSSAYNYGYRRCNNGTADDHGSPYFRTVLSYSCTSAPRVGRYSNPNINYLGVPQGVDPAVDPANGAWNALTINNSAAYMAGFRSSSVVTMPSAPSNLQALSSGYNSMTISWVDASDNESSFTIQRSLNPPNWTTVATLGSNQTFYDDNGLVAATEYHYQVRAQNSAGSSSYSNAASDTTDVLPSNIEDFAISESSPAGSASGNYTATYADDGVVEIITEASSGGPRHRRKQSFTHTWAFDVFGGIGGVVLTANTWVSGSEGANFYYSVNGGSNWNLMFTVDENANSTMKTFSLPATAIGEVLIQARDAEQTAGESVDYLSIDYLVISSYSTPGDPPTAPSSLSTMGVSFDSVDLSFTDNADNEFGFEVWRRTTNPGSVCAGGSSINSIGTSSGVGAAVPFTDSTAAPETTYWYWATAFNSGGDSGCSEVVEATTMAAPDISMSANGYKVKGKHRVDLTWSGVSTTQADIYRDNTLIQTSNDGVHTDNIGAKGSATYLYKVCDQNSTTMCSVSVNVVF